MEQEIIQKHILAGEINHNAQKLAKKLIKPGVNLFEVGEKINSFILENKGVPAWPVNLSINHEAAHNTYNPEKQYILKEEDVLKVDIGVSIDGYLSDSAITIIFSKKHETLKEASDKALANSKKFLQENLKTATISDIGTVIENTIRSYNFKPIINLTGHVLGHYHVHDYPSIPNVKNGLKIKFSEIDKAFAIEPFSSTGDGYVNEGDEVLIFEHIDDRPLRNKEAKILLEEIKRYNGLPFSEIWIGKGMDSFSKKFALRELLKSEAIASYPVLIDKKGSFVSQAETSFIITKDGLIDLVKVDEL